jgi:hypothetical protein
MYALAPLAWATATFYARRGPRSGHDQQINPNSTGSSTRVEFSAPNRLLRRESHRLQTILLLVAELAFEILQRDLNRQNRAPSRIEA